jgi:hypothetical protein
MKASILLGALLAARLALACGAWAQAAPVSGHVVPPRLEIGGTVGAIWFEPTVGILASVRTSARSALETGANITPYFVLTQAQLRVRLPLGPPGGARRSLVAGLSHLSRRRSTGGGLETGLAAHAGMSAQAPVSRHVDVRADAQMIVPFRDGPGADPRAVVAVVWHP